MRTKARRIGEFDMPMLTLAADGRNGDALDEGTGFEGPLLRRCSKP